MRGALIGLAGAALLAGGAVPASAEPLPGDTVVVDPFDADSGDACRFGATDGLLAWHLNALREVDVRGTVVDRAGPSQPCADDGRFTAALFTAYAGGVPVGPPVVQPVDNGRRTFTFSFTSTRPISVVVVQVCRRPRVVPGPREYCGTPEVHHAPVTIG
jgi:hypothetical protein